LRRLKKSSRCARALLCMRLLFDIACSRFPRKVGQNTSAVPLPCLCCSGCVSASVTSPHPPRLIELRPYAN
jgi:hypothetical protein